ncbi:MAG: acyloxyacyl hydrolase, partial [Dongiaceae bacterium]
SMGWYDVNMQKNESAAFELLYRFGRPFFWKVKPFLGVMANSDLALYAYGGLGLDLQLSDSWYFYPNVGVGAYSQGDSKDLGYGIEFHDSLELGYQFENNARLGLSFTHMSNAGLGNKNPGTEILSVVYAIPFGR